MVHTPIFLANAGVPMLAVQLPILLLLLLPIIALEAAVFVRLLKLPWRGAFAIATAANLASTVVGVPLTWGVLFGVEILVSGGGGHGLSSPWGVFQTAVVQAPWLIPYESALYWLVPVANLVLLPGYFLASVFSEQWMVRFRRRDLDPRATKRAVWLANAATYGLILIGSVTWLVTSVDGRWPSF
jgi:hypothetical protein